LDEGVIDFAGEVILARDAKPQRDPGLVLRVAAASATTGIPIAASTLGRMAEIAPELRAPWPRDALDDLLVLLSAGPTTVTTIEALDRTGLWGRIFPEWGAVRDLPPRDPIHIWTVDRHLVETVSRASAFTSSRPAAYSACGVAPAALISAIDSRAAVPARDEACAPRSLQCPSAR
jgi:[protein-PII] uridylyltransferase